MMAYSVMPLDEEIMFGKDETIVFKTDMIGQPHSIIRHPDMPRAVFKLLWDSIESLNEVIGAIAAATEEQTLATMEISRNIQETSQATTEVSQNIIKVSETAAQTLDCASEMPEASSEMEKKIADLKEQSEQFISSIRVM